MSSWFDSVVYERRRKSQWMTPSLLAFVRDVLSNIWLDKDDKSDTSVVFTAVNRPDVATRFWYTLEWLSEDGKRKSASSQEYDLLMWRAAVIEMDAREETEGKHTGRFSVEEMPRSQIVGRPELPIHATLNKAISAAIEQSAEDKTKWFEVWSLDTDATLALVRGMIVYRNG